MSNPLASRIPKWPFFTGDALVVLAAAYVATHSQQFGPWPAAICTAGVAFGAWLATRPYLEEYRARLKLADSINLVESLSQITQIEGVAAQISGATGQWQSVNEHAGKSVQAAREISEKMQTESRDFRVFLDRANDTEKSHLRLEIDKLKRGEAEWLQILVRLLDNTFALYLAALRSRQAPLIEQISQFQNVSRDAARRVGLVPFVPNPGDRFDAKLFETVEGPDKVPPPEAVVAEIVATGYTFQGQLLRRPLVVPGMPAPPPPPESEASLPPAAAVESIETDQATPSDHEQPLGSETAEETVGHHHSTVQESHPEGAEQPEEHAPEVEEGSEPLSSSHTESENEPMQPEDPNQQKFF